MTFLDGVVQQEGKIKIGALTLETLLDPSLAAGQAVRVGFRPEDVQVRNLAGDAPNLLTVRLVRLEYLGSFCRAVLEPEASPGLHLLADLSANAMRDLSLAAGQSIKVSLRPQTLHVFPSPPGGAPS
jgi:iron(III) transport system ATP-binding protein